MKTMNFALALSIFAGIHFSQRSLAQMIISETIDREVLCVPSNANSHELPFVIQTGTLPQEVEDPATGQYMERSVKIANLSLIKIKSKRGFPISTQYQDLIDLPNNYNPALVNRDRNLIRVASHQSCSIYEGSSVDPSEVIDCYWHFRFDHKDSWSIDLKTALPPLGQGQKSQVIAIRADPQNYQCQEIDRPDKVWYAGMDWSCVARGESCKLEYYPN